MTESAISLREQKRWETSHRISMCAQRLTDAHGLDGFTMDELADAAEVSRRTLFNYFPSKLDAVLGTIPELPAEALATFQAGGPHGSLIEDLGALAKALLAAKEPDREAMLLTRRVLSSSARVLAAAHQRFEQITDDFTALILEREGDDFGIDRARLAIRIIGALFDSALTTFLEGGERPVDELFDRYLTEARSLFA
ncbi:TetR/AcrR family transcriptional regulator [Nocardioides sp. URHA0020]|uniref:TetR/AcrR family transcriptional regulator n=1 Tax=Nocardioides sp. URHA0020 TaxID=1380392 RepID=UPI000687E925|nr:TetR/AcrR family transcriptional regulator [Nocardioides sp. URHA0020]